MIGGHDLACICIGEYSFGRNTQATAVRTYVSVQAARIERRFLQAKKKSGTIFHYFIPIKISQIKIKVHYM